MSKDEFRFKQFSVVQSHCAMKVGTDGVLVGAWAGVDDGVGEVWDVGCGCGLIALMLAQRCRGRITGIEIDNGAAGDACRNFATSQWADRLEVVTGDFCRLWAELPRPELIVSNPPFFKSSLRCDDARRCDARHEGRLGVAELVAIAGKALGPGGRLCMVTPADREGDVEEAAVFARLSVARMVRVRTVAGKEPKRVLWELRRDDCCGPTDVGELTVYDAVGEYSEAYRALTSDYYLNM